VSDAISAEAKARGAGRKVSPMSAFFIERPIFASVIAIMYHAWGLVAFQVLPFAAIPCRSRAHVDDHPNAPRRERRDASRTVRRADRGAALRGRGPALLPVTSSSNGTLTIRAPIEWGPTSTDATIQGTTRADRAPRLPDDVKRTAWWCTRPLSIILLFVA